MSGGGWSDSRPLFEGLGKALPAGWTAHRLFYHDPEAKPATDPPNEESLVRRLRDGCEFVFHGGHGSDDGWDGCLSTGSLPKFAGAPSTPILFSAGCSTATFAALPPYQAYQDVQGAEHKGTDAGEVFTAPPPFPAPYQAGRFDRTGLGETLLRGGPGGAVAYIGCNTGSQPCALSLIEGFVHALARDEKDARLGDAWREAVTFYHKKERLGTLVPNDDWYPPSIFFQGMKFMLFGDPSLCVRRAD